MKIDQLKFFRIIFFISSTILFLGIFIIPFTLFYISYKGETDNRSCDFENLHLDLQKDESISDSHYSEREKKLIIVTNKRALVVNLCKNQLEKQVIFEY